MEKRIDKQNTVKKISILFLLGLSACAISKHETNNELVVYQNKSTNRMRTSTSYYIFRKSPQTFVHIQSNEYAIFGSWIKNGDTMFLKPKLYTTPIFYTPFVIHSPPFLDLNGILNPSFALIAKDRIIFEDSNNIYYSARSSSNTELNNPEIISIYISKIRRRNTKKTLLISPDSFLMCISNDSAFYIGTTKNTPSFNDSIVLTTRCYARNVKSQNKIQPRRNLNRNRSPNSFCKDTLFFHLTYKIRCDLKNVHYKIDSVPTAIGPYRTPYFRNRIKFHSPESGDIFIKIQKQHTKHSEHTTNKGTIYI